MLHGTPTLGTEEALLLDESVTFSGAVRLAGQHRPTGDPKQSKAFDDTYGSNKRHGQTAVGELTHQEEPIMNSHKSKQLGDDIEFDLGYEGPMINFNRQVSAFPESNE